MPSERPVKMARILTLLASISTLVLAPGGLPPPAAAQVVATFEGLGTWPGGSSTFASDVSDDGQVVVGYAYDSQGIAHAFRWTPASGMEDLGTLGGAGAYASAASADGSVIVGRSWDSAGSQHAFRWRAGIGMAPLPMWDAADVSADGTVVVGMAVRWTESGGAEYPAGVTFAFGISPDGQWVVGDASSGRAFRWSAATGMQDLGILEGPGSFASAASTNSAVVVGQAQVEEQKYWFWHAFRWTAARGMVDLGTLGGPQSAAYDVSDDGSVIVGKSLITSSSASERAFRWTARKQMQDLRRELLDLGARAVENWILFSATGVSADGTVIAGYGLNPSRQWEAFRAVLPLPR